MAGVVENNILTPALAQFQAAASISVVTIATAGNVALSDAVTLNADDQAVANRIRSAQDRLNQGLTISAILNA